MSNLSVDGTSTWITGTTDSYTPTSDGPSGTIAVSALFNGLLKFAIDAQTILGSAASLKGTSTDLASRLARFINSAGGIQSGTVFPTSPPPITGQFFYRTDTQIIYLYDAATAQWVSPFQSILYALRDGTSQFTGPLTIKSVTPGIRYIGQEASALDWTLREDGGSMRLYRNTGTEAVPVLTEDNFFVPTGAFLPFGGVSAPNGWAMCDGGALSRTTYARLFSVIDTAYGSGDGSTTFNVPDLRGRVVIGVDAATGRITSASVNGANAATLGGAGGAETHTLTAGQTPLPSHTHGTPTSTTTGGSSTTVNSTINSVALGQPVVTTTAASASATAHSNTQPWLTCNYIIKT